MALLRVDAVKVDGHHAFLPVERQPQIANPLSQFDHLALLHRSPLQVHHADAAQGREPVKRGLIVTEDFLKVSGGNAQLGAPIITLWNKEGGK